MYEDLKDFAYPNSIKNLKIRFSKLENPGYSVPLPFVIK